MSFRYQSLRREELRKQSTTDEDYKHGLTTYYLRTHPSASWAHIGGGLLWYERGGGSGESKGTHCA